MAARNYTLALGADVDNNIDIAQTFATRIEATNVWSVSMQVGDAERFVPDRGEAIDWVEHKFAAFLLTELGKSDPQEWPHDARSIELISMRKNDPEKYAVRIEDLRSGRLERIRTKR